MMAGRFRMFARVVAIVAISVSLMIGGLAVPSSVSAFTGHGCTRATCQYFTSSYSTTVYYYNRKTCSGWKSLTDKYLRGFKTSTALLAKYPNRKLHKPC